MRAQTLRTVLRTGMCLLGPIFLVLAGCGGGGSGRSPETEDTPPASAEAPPAFYSVSPASSLEEDMAALERSHDALHEAYAALAGSLAGPEGLLSLAAELDGMSLGPDTAQEWADRSAAVQQALDAAFVQGARLVVEAYNVEALSAALAQARALGRGDGIRSGRSAPVVGTAIALGLAGYTVYQLYQGIVGAHDQAQGIVGGLARSGEEGRKEVIRIMRDHGVDLPDDATPEAIETAFQQQWFLKRSRIAQDVKAFVGDRMMQGGADADTYVDLADEDRQNAVGAARALGEVAVDATVAAGTSVTGSVGSLVGGTAGDVVDVTLTVTGLDPVSTVKQVTVTGMSPETRTVYPEPPSGFGGTDRAEEVFEQVAAGGEEALQVSYGDLVGAMEVLGQKLSWLAGGDGSMLEIPLRVFSAVGELFVEDGTPKVRVPMPTWMQGGTAIVTADGVSTELVEDVDLENPPPVGFDDDGTPEQDDGTADGGDSGGGGSASVVDTETLAGATHLSVRFRVGAVCTWSTGDVSGSDTTSLWLINEGPLELDGEAELATDGTVTVTSTYTTVSEGVTWNVTVTGLLNINDFELRDLLVEQRTEDGNYANRLELKEVPLKGALRWGEASWWVGTSAEDLTGHVADFTYSGVSPGWSVLSGDWGPLQGCEPDFSDVTFDFSVTNDPSTQ